MGHDAIHASAHTDGTDDIQSATISQKGLATAEQAGKLTAILNLTNTTTDDTPTELFADGASVQAILPASTSWAFFAVVASYQTAGSSGAVGNASMFTFTGLIRRDGSDNTALIGTVDEVEIAMSEVGYDAVIDADDTTEALRITVTAPGADRTINWKATIYLTQVS